ncbi:MAG: hypothetical protein J6Y99_07995 [Bacteroidales bacterium]|nr:hypothetical protein [Bacteroidales bacterium]
MEKRFFSRVLVALVSVVLFMSSCSENIKLKMAVEAADAQCPKSLGGGLELTHATYENLYKNHAVTFYYTADENYVNIDNMAANPETTKNGVLAMFQNPDANTKTFLDLVIGAKADVRYVYKSKTSGKEFSTTLTAAELEENLKNGATTTSDKLSAAISATNMQMPIDTGTGIVITKVEDCGDVVFYLASVNDEATLKMISDNAASVKENIVNSLKTINGAAEKVFFKLIIDAGKDLGYRYSAEGVDEPVDIVISNAELKEIRGE